MDGKISEQIEQLLLSKGINIDQTADLASEILELYSISEARKPQENV